MALVWLVVVANQSPTVKTQDIRTLRTDGRVYSLEIADTAMAQQKGLSGRQNLAPDGGMIFVFEGVTDRCFWMKDMNFPIDIIWVDGWRVVTRVMQDVRPETYPESYCAPAKHVIELKAGEADKAGIAAGKQLDF